MVFPRLVTERLVLREINHEDAESIFAILNSPDVIKYDSFELYTDIKQAEGFIDWIQKEFENERCIFWGITLMVTLT